MIRRGGLKQNVTIKSEQGFYILQPSTDHMFKLWRLWRSSLWKFHLSPDLVYMFGRGWVSVPVVPIHPYSWVLFHSPESRMDAS